MRIFDEVTNRLKTTEASAEKIWKPDNIQLPADMKITFHLQYRNAPHGQR